MGEKPTHTPDELQRRITTAEAGLAKFQNIFSSGGKDLFQGSLERARQKNPQDFATELILVGERRFRTHRRIRDKSFEIIDKHIRKLKANNPDEKQLDHLLGRNLITRDEYDEAMKAIDEKTKRSSQRKPLETDASTDKVRTFRTSGSAPSEASPKKGRKKDGTTMGQRLVLSIKDNPGLDKAALFDLLYPGELNLSMTHKVGRINAVLNNLKHQPDAPKIRLEGQTKGRGARPRLYIDSPKAQGSQESADGNTQGREEVFSKGGVFLPMKVDVPISPTTNEPQEQQSIELSDFVSNMFTDDAKKVLDLILKNPDSTKEQLARLFVERKPKPEDIGRIGELIKGLSIIFEQYEFGHFAPIVPGRQRDQVVHLELSSSAINLPHLLDPNQPEYISPNRPIVSRERFIQVLNEQEAKLYQLLLRNPNLSVEDLTKKLVEGRKVKSSDISTTNTLLTNLENRMRAHNTNERIIRDNPTGSTKNQRLHLGFLDGTQIPVPQEPNETPALSTPHPDTARKSQAQTLTPDKAPDIQKPSTKHVHKPNSATKQTVTHEAYKEIKLSTEQFSSIQESIIDGLAEVIISRFASIGILANRDLPLTKDPSEFLQVSSLTERQITSFMRTLGNAMTPQRIATGLAVMGLERLWQLTDADMIGATAQQTALYQKVRAVKNRFLFGDVASQLFDHFGVEIPNKYKVPIRR